MGAYVTDTHPLLWHLTRDSRLSPSAKNVFERTDAGADQVIIPSIVLIEIIYLIEKKRFPLALIDQVLGLLRNSTPNYWVANLDVEVILAARSINRSDIPELPDRVIAATAKHVGLPLISRDSAIRNSNAIPVVW